VAATTDFNHDDNDHPSENSEYGAQQPVLLDKQKELAFSDTVIDGSKFILELTNAELEKLGFKINHYAVYYRNHYENQKVFYLATHSNGRFSISADSTSYYMNENYYPLQTDTIAPENTLKCTNLFALVFRRMSENGVRIDIEYQKTAHSFYPLFCTNQTGENEKINDQFNFDEVADTLMPVVIKFPQLDLEKKRDQFFWFKTNEDFYTNLPERYAWVKEEFEALKSTKKTRGNKLNVDFNIKDWNKELRIPENVVLDGKNYIVQFTKEELEKVGIFKHQRFGWSHSHCTPYSSGITGGFETVFVDGSPYLDVDTTFLVDYYIKYNTDCLGDFRVNQTTIKRMNDFFNDDDILLPVQTENSEGEIFWFTLSEEFWKLVPERYQYLKKHYAQILYNKSIEPNRNFVKYFTEPFKKVGVNISIIDLNKDELENLGFKFVDGGSEISCGFGKNWIKYWFTDKRNKEVAKLSTEIPKRPPFEHLQYFTPSKEYPIPEVVEKYDSLFAASNQGYQFVYITDSLGRHTQRINIPRNDLQINGEDFKYLIPVMVRNSKFATPYSEDRVFWFTPTEAFFDRLPVRIKNELAKEYKIVSSEGKSAELSACTYFESCRSTLKVENMKIYPNPAKREITIDFILEKAQAGEILLANIAGQQVKQLQSKSNFKEGFNTVKCQLDGIKPGIYLVSIVTPLGFKTERLIVSE